MTRHPIHWPRAVTAAVGVYVTSAVVCVALELAVFIPVGAPLAVRVLTGFLIGVVGLYVVLPRLRWWYRPARRETEKHL